MEPAAWALIGGAVGIGLVWLFAYFVRPKKDISWNRLDPALDWKGGKAESLKKVYDHVVAFSESSIEWYRRGRQPKRRWGIALRIGALLATASAGLIPISEQLTKGSWKVPPVWSTVLLAAAGILVSIDALGGFTSGWVRYMLAQQKIERLRDTFLLESNALQLVNASEQDQIERAKTFLLAVGKVIDDETRDWATEFQNALKEMERARREATEHERTGALEVCVKNPEAVTEWSLEIDGSHRGRTTGKTLAVTDVFIGVRKIRAFGEDIKGRLLCDERTIKIDSGATTIKELELS